MRILGMVWVIALAAVLLIAPASHAFDTYYHFKLMDDEMKAQDFSECAIKIAQIGNWYVDYYTSAGVGDGGRADYLHFDDLFSTDAEAAHLDWLGGVLNRKIGTIMSSGEPWQSPLGGDECDCLSLLLTIGMGTHAIQDFYCHSNWRNINWAAMGYNNPTWDDVKPEDRQAARDADGNGIYSGSYSGKSKPGMKTHSELNADDSSRPGNAAAMNMAARATAQWLTKFRGWIGEECWQKLKNCCPDDRKGAINSEWNWAKRLSQATGHWSTESMGPDVVTAGLGYKTTPDTLLNERWKKILHQMFKTAQPPKPEYSMAVPDFPEGTAYVSVTVEPEEQITFTNPFPEETATITVVETKETHKVPPGKSLTIPLAAALIYASQSCGAIAICAEKEKETPVPQTSEWTKPRIDGIQIGDTKIEKLPLQSGGAIPPLAVSGCMPSDSQLQLAIPGSDGKMQRLPAQQICSIGGKDNIRQEIVRFPTVPMGAKSASLELADKNGKVLAERKMDVADAAMRISILPERGNQGSEATATLDAAGYLQTIQASRWGFDPSRYVFQLDYSRSGGATGPSEVPIPPGQGLIKVPIKRGSIAGTFPIGFRLVPKASLPAH